MDVDSLSASVEKYLELFSVGYSLNAAKTSDIDDPSFGHLLRLAHDYGDGSRVALVVGFGEEAETVAPGVVQVTDTRSVSLSGLHWTSTAWGIHLGSRLVRAGRSLRPRAGAPWTRTPVLN